MERNFFRNRLAVICALTIISFPVNAANHCVSNATEFHTALSNAASNNESDIIRLVGNTFVGNFIYASTSSAGLTISGGWTADCRVISTELITVLDGNAEGNVLAISAPNAVQIDVDSIVVTNGLTSRRGAGLFVTAAQGISLTSVKASNNRVTGPTTASGGGAYLQSQTVSVSKSEFFDNIVDTSAGCTAGDPEQCSSGGGLLAVGKYIEIANSEFVGNFARVWGGGAALGLNCGQAAITDNEFSNNESTSEGGGLFAFCRESVDVEKNSFSSNRSGYGGGANIYVESMSGEVHFGESRLGLNHFVSNRASSSGGGLVLSGRAKFVVADNEFVDNSASGTLWQEGSGGALSSRALQIQLSRNHFSRNSAHLGGAIADAKTNYGDQAHEIYIGSNLFFKNRGYAGGAVYIEQYPGDTISIDFVHNTLVENIAESQGGALHIELFDEESQETNIFNNLFVANIAPQGADFYLENDADEDFFASSVDLRGNILDLDGGLWTRLFFEPDQSNLHFPSLDFVDQKNEDFSLPVDSPAIDRGVQLERLPVSDIEGQPRVQGPRPDIGAYETSPNLSISALVGSHDSFASVRWSGAAEHYLGVSANASSGVLGQETTFLSDAIREVISISGVSNNGSPQFAVCGVMRDGGIRIQMRDVLTGSFVRNQQYFGPSWHPLGIAGLKHPDASYSHGLAVLGRNLISGEIAVQVRDAATGQFGNNVFFLNPGWQPRQLLVFEDIDANSGPELGVLATNDAGQIVVMIKDAATNTFIKNVFFLNANWTPIQAIVLDDINANGVQEIGLLAQNKDSGQLVVMVKDAATNTFINNVFPLGSGWEPIKVVALPDENANGAQELAVLGVNKGSGKLVIQVRDSRTGQFLRNLEPLGSNWAPKDMIVLPDIGGGVPGLSVLAIRKSDDLPVVQTIEAISGDLVSNVFLN